MMKFLSLLLVLTLVTFVNGSPITSECTGKQTLEHTYIGANKDVSVEHYWRTNNFVVQGLAQSINNHQEDPNNQCGAACTTQCYTPSGGGPDPNDCQVIANALLFESQHTGPMFTIGPAGTGFVNFVRLTYSSCNTTFVNQDDTPMIYCRSDWAGVAGYVAKNCQATQNARGGICVAKDQQFFIQINHS